MVKTVYNIMASTAAVVCTSLTEIVSHPKVDIFGYSQFLAAADLRGEHDGVISFTIQQELSVLRVVKKNATDLKKFAPRHKFRKWL